MARHSVNDLGVNSQTDRSAKQKIIENACFLFKQRGYFGVSINDIAKASGISKSTVYHYFRSKNELVLAAIDLESGKLTASWKSLEKQSGEKKNQQLQKMLAGFSEHFSLHNGNLITTLAHEGEGIAVEIAGAIRKVFEQWYHDLQTTIGVQMGLNKAQTKEVTSHLMLRLFGGLLLSKVYKDPSFANQACDCKDLMESLMSCEA